MPIGYVLHLEVSKTITGYSLNFKYDSSICTSEASAIIGKKYSSFIDRMISRSFSNISSFQGIRIPFSDGYLQMIQAINDVDHTLDLVLG